jgi:mono/diheme cytochrome c family protein
MVMRGLIGVVLCALATLSTLAAATDFGRQSYLLNCAGCHQTDASGSALNDVPTLHRIPGEFVKVPRGREFLCQVPGIVYSALSDADVAEILNWVLYTFSKDNLPADFKPYTTAEVAQHRAIRPANIMKVRESVIRDLKRAGIDINYAQH